MWGFNISVTQCSEYARIWLNNPWINCSDFGKVPKMPGQVLQGFEYSSGSKYARAEIMASLWICEGYTGCWISLNMP